MMNRKRTTPPSWEGARRGWESSKQTVQVHSLKDNSISVNTQYAVRILAARYRLSLPRANVIADLAGLGMGR
jgi:hypothetical protein